MTVAIYVRVSTAEQRTDLQLDEIRSYCGRKGFTIAAQYSDTLSGAKAQRPGLLALMEAARRREFMGVVCWKFDRMARSLSQLVSTLEQLDHLGIQFVSVREEIDTTQPAGRMLFGVIASLAEFERSMIRERVRAGISAAQRRGVRFGRPQIDVDPKRVLRLRATGQSFSQIASALGISVGTAHSICKSTAVSK